MLTKMASGTITISQPDLWSMPTATVSGSISIPTLPVIPALPGLPYPIYSMLHIPRIEIQTVIQELQSYNTTMVIKSMTDVLFSIIPSSFPTMPDLDFSFTDVLAGAPDKIITACENAIKKGIQLPGIPNPIYSMSLAPAEAAVHTYMIMVRQYIQMVTNFVIGLINQVIGKLSQLGLPGLPALPTIPSPSSVLTMLQNMVNSEIQKAKSMVSAAIASAESSVKQAENEISLALNFVKQSEQKVTDSYNSLILAESKVQQNASTANQQLLQTAKSNFNMAQSTLISAQNEYSSIQSSANSTYNSYKTALSGYKAPSISQIAGSIPTKFGFPAIPFPDPLVPTISQIDREMIQVLDTIHTSFSTFVLKLIAGWGGWNIIGGLPLPSPISVSFSC